ncbi:MAG: 5-formyltetrahydrofolate cyclo-ligase [Hyphomicrobiaceae bacterium]|nr:5-formyltetrahydrofolate cyclo-ligase [Hyphomicrobiaceae bacterium]
MAAKKAMRDAAKARRNAAFAVHGARAGERLAEHGLGFAGLSGGATVASFLAIGEEIDPLPLMRRLWGEGHATGLPVMIGKGQPLVFRPWREGDALADAMWGIREPLAEAGEIEPDVVLVPLLAFDLAGYRLGYGGGFYDRTLALLRQRKPLRTIGLAYDELKVDAVPHCDYDERLDWVLTPSGPLRVGGDP